MKEIIEDIRNLLNADKYSNEEQVRFSLVARIIQKLDWNIWNPKQVYTEFKPNPTNDNKKVDIALFLNGNSPSIFIEIKSPEKLNNSNELLKAETQLKDYNADLTALFTILTDGNQWRFYYSQEGGTFSQKRFKTIKLKSDDVEDIEMAFEMFLKKDVVQNGDAKDKAYSYLQLSRKQKIMEECIPQAKREIENNPLLNLVGALIQTTQIKGLNISDEEALEFIQNFNAKKTGHSEFQELRTESQTQSKLRTIATTKERTNYGDNPPNLKFTVIEMGTIGSQKKKNWNQLLTVCLKQLINSGWSKEEINTTPSVKIIKGHPTKDGFNIIEGTQFFLRYLNANNAAKALIDLSRRSGFKLEIDFYWTSEQRAAYPNKKGRISVN